VAIAAAAAIGATPLPGQSLAPDTAQTLPVDPAIRIRTLDNGLRYYIRVNPQPERRAELRLVINAGSVLEDDDQRGLAHFVEHMAFNGTARFRKQALVDFIEGLGMRFGAHLNAGTGFDETIYQLQVPTDSAGVLGRAFDILEDWAHAVSFEPEEINRERGVVIEEWRLGLGAESRMQDRQLPVLFRGSRYADRLPIGDRRTLETFPDSALVRYYRDWYRPSLMAVIAVGDFNADSVEAMIRARFAPLRNPPAPRPRTTDTIPVADSTLVAVATDPEASGTRASINWRVPDRPPGTVAAYRAGLVDQLHHAMLNARLAELTQRADPPFIGAGVGQGRLARSAAVFSVGLGVAEGRLVQGVEAAMTEVERARRHGFTETELDRAKEELIRGYERAWAERDKSYSFTYADEYGRNFLEQEPIPGIGVEYDLVRRLVPVAPLEEVNGVTARLAGGSRGRILLVNAPARDGTAAPDPTVLLAVAEQVTRTDIAPYVDVVSDAPLVGMPPSTRAIVAERRDPRIGTIEWQLAGGMRVIVKPTDFRADEVLLTGYSPGGVSLAPDQGYLSSALAPTLVSLGGLGGFDAVALDKKLSGKAARVMPYFTVTQEGVAGSASPKDLATLFQLVYLTFTAPRADTTAFRGFIANARAALSTRGTNPEAVFGDTLQVTLTQHHPRARPVTSALVDSLDLETAFRFYRDRFADASDFTFVLVGTFSPDSVRPLVERWLGGLPALMRKEQWRDPGIVPPRGVQTRTVFHGLEPKSRTAMVFTGPFRYTRAERVALRGLAEVLEIRLRENLREALGATYGVDVQAQPARWPREEYTLSVSFGSAPERAEALSQAVLAEIDTLRQRGPREQDLAKVRETELRERETALRQNRYWLNQIAFHDQYGEDPAAIADPRGDADLLTVEALREVARRYLDPGHYVRVTLLPERGVPAAPRPPTR
jgi:zinc protease